MAGTGRSLVLPTLDAENGRGNPAAYGRRVRAWSLYDWANHAYITVTATTFFPPYFIAIAAVAFMAPGATPSDSKALAMARDSASNVYALTVSAALLLAAVLSPLVGTWADITGRRKRALIATTLFGAVTASAMVSLTTGRWVAGLALYFVTQVAVNIALGLNSSLLPHVATGTDMDRVSSLGYAMGYVGGGLLLALSTILYFAAPHLDVDRSVAVRLAFLSVGVWWLCFSIPMVRRVGEPPALPLAHGRTGYPLGDAVVRLRHTLMDLRRYRHLFTMLVAFWLYMEGVGAIILLATAYGAALGLDTGVLTLTLLMTQFVAFPYALLFARVARPDWPWRNSAVALVLWNAATLPVIGVLAGRRGAGTLEVLGLIAADQVVGALVALTAGRWACGRLAAKLDAKRTVILGLAVYTIIPVWGFFLSSQAEFLVIGFLVGTVQGGTQALSRSIFASLSPRAKSGEFFGLYGLAEKFAGIFGPLLYGVVGQLTHDPRSSVLSILAFFLAGMAVLSRVDVAGGAAVAAAENVAIATAGAAD